MSVIDDLEREWSALAASPAVQGALRRWAEHEPALRFGSVRDLVARVERRDVHPAAADRVLAALARRASHDELAARLLLQLLLPGCKRLASRYHRGDPVEGAAAVVAAAYERIRTYPIERRPARVAANVLGDVRQRLGRSAARQRHDLSLERLGEAELPPVPAGPPPAAEVVGVLGWAVRAGHLDREVACLIALTRVGGLRVSELARSIGTNEQSLRRRRQRAEARLRRLVAA